MTLKEALDALKIAFANFETAARSDDKTPLQNALALNEAKEAFATTAESPRIVIFADINRLKAINTEYGYAAGDATISQVGLLIQEHFVEKMEGQAFRPSGDEFVILLQNQFLGEFKLLVPLFADCEVPLDDKRFSIGVSFGFAFSSEEIEFEIIKSRAEIACKKAKIKGAGICLEWAEEMEQTALENMRDTCSKCGTINVCDVPMVMSLRRLKVCAACGIGFG